MNEATNETTHELITESPENLALDGVVAAPDHHRVVYEDERVRLVELRVPPGDLVPVHTHRWPTINYVLGWSDFQSYDAEGRLKLDSRTDASEIREGAVFRLPALPPPHAVKNVGDRLLLGISVELKDSAPE